MITQPGGLAHITYNVAMDFDLRGYVRNDNSMVEFHYITQIPSLNLLESHL